MTNTTKYLVKLKPLSSYYFGGERSFGFGQNQSYLVRSRRWPQQTTLLGAMRYLILQQEGLLATAGRKVNQKAKDFIGETSFHLGDDNHDLEVEMAFGQIKCLSPVFLMDGDTSYLPAPITEGKNLEAAPKAKVWYGTGEAKAAQDLRKYKAKTGLETFYVSVDGKEFVSEDAIFQSVEQVGIEKGRNGQPRTEAFYKQTSYAFSQQEPKTGPKRNWCFAFYLTVDKSLQLSGQVIMPIGGERRRFLVEFTPSQEAFPQIQGITKQEGLLLLSDALVKPEIYAHCRFAAVETLSFRFIRTAVAETSRYANLGPEENKQDARKSVKYNLLRKGSVLYPEDLNQVRGQLDLKRLQQIGYNQYQPLNL